MRTKIGVLSLQGHCKEHLQLLHRCGAETIEVTEPEQLIDVQGIIIYEEIKEYPPLLKQKFMERALEGMGCLALSSGILMVAKNVINSGYDSLPLMDITVNAEKKARINQIKSLIIPAISERSIKAVFKNAPIIEKVAPNVGILYQFNNNNIVFVRQGNFLACTFNPELAGDIRIYQYFIQMVKDSRKTIDKIN